MILGYDPIAKELIIGQGDGSPEMAIPVSDLTLKVYGDEGAFVASITFEGLDVRYFPIVQSPAGPRLETLGVNHWYVRLG